MTYKYLYIAILLCLGIKASAQQTDPTLAGAVGLQTAMLKDVFATRENTQQKIIAAEAAVTVAMDRMHQVENKMLDYLSNAQGAMQNLYQIKRATELVTSEIPQNMDLVRKSVPGHLKGTAIALLVFDGCFQSYGSLKRSSRVTSDWTTQLAFVRFNPYVVTNVR